MTLAGSPKTNVEDWWDELDGTGGPMGTATFSTTLPYGGLAEGPDGNLYLADGVIRRVTPGGAVSTLSTFYSVNQATALLAVDPRGRIFSEAEGVIWALDPSTKQQWLVSTPQSAIPIKLDGGPGCTDGPLSQASIGAIDGLAADANDNIYFIDHLCRSVRKIDANLVVTTIAGNGAYGHQDGTGSLNGTAEFELLVGIALGPDGTLYVTDDNLAATQGTPDGGGTIRAISPTGEVTTVAGNAQVYGYVTDSGCPDGTGGPNGTATFGTLGPITVDGQGNLYVIDSVFLPNGSALIRKVDTSGQVTTLAGGQYGTGDDGAGGCNGPASFGVPLGIAVDSTGAVVVFDDAAISAGPLFRICDTACVETPCANHCCPPGWLLCGGVCTDPASDVANCGQCGHGCSAGTTCDNGSCGSPVDGGLSWSCAPGLTLCETDGDETCDDLQGDYDNCGQCGHVCSFANGDGFRCAGGTCIDTGPEQSQCSEGLVACHGSCANLSSDSNNCGGCDQACQDVQICLGGACLPPIPDGGFGPTSSSSSSSGPTATAAGTSSAGAAGTSGSSGSSRSSSSTGGTTSGTSSGVGSSGSSGNANRQDECLPCGLVQPCPSVGDLCSENPGGTSPACAPGCSGPSDTSCGLGYVCASVIVIQFASGYGCVPDAGFCSASTNSSSSTGSSRGTSTGSTGGTSGSTGSDECASCSSATPCASPTDLCFPVGANGQGYCVVECSPAIPSSCGQGLSCESFGPGEPSYCLPPSGVCPSSSSSGGMTSSAAGSSGSSGSRGSSGSTGCSVCG